MRFFFSTFGRMYALPSMTLCFRNVMKCFQSPLFRYYLNEFQMIPFSLSISCTRVFSCYIPLVLYTYSKASDLKNVSASSCTTFIYTVIECLLTAMLFIFTDYQFRFFVSIFACWFHNWVISFTSNSLPKKYLMQETGKQCLTR